MALRLCVTLQQIEHFSSYCEKHLNKQLQILQSVSPNHGYVIWGLGWLFHRAAAPLPLSNTAYHWSKSSFV